MKVFFVLIFTLNALMVGLLIQENVYMSKITDFAAAQSAKLDAVSGKVGAISLKLDDIQLLLNAARSGDLTPEEQAALDDLSARIDALSAQTDATAQKADSVK